MTGDCLLEQEGKAAGVVLRWAGQTPDCSAGESRRRRKFMRRSRSGVVSEQKTSRVGGKPLDSASLTKQGSENINRHD